LDVNFEEFYDIEWLECRSVGYRGKTLIEGGTGVVDETWTPGRGNYEQETVRWNDRKGGHFQRTTGESWFSEHLLWLSLV
jgi:hypothetical protein